MQLDEVLENYSRSDKLRIAAAFGIVFLAYSFIQLVFPVGTYSIMHYYITTAAFALLALAARKVEKSRGFSGAPGALPALLIGLGLGALSYAALNVVRPGGWNPAQAAGFWATAISAYVLICFLLARLPRDEVLNNSLFAALISLAPSLTFFLSDGIARVATASVNLLPAFLVFYSFFLTRKLWLGSAIITASIATAFLMGSSLSATAVMPSVTIKNILNVFIVYAAAILALREIHSKMQNLKATSLQSIFGR